MVLSTLETTDLAIIASAGTYSKADVFISKGALELLVLERIKDNLRCPAETNRDENSLRGVVVAAECVDSLLPEAHRAVDLFLCCQVSNLCTMLGDFDGRADLDLKIVVPAPFEGEGLSWVAISSDEWSVP
jgi:hypothetical protein